MKNQTTKENLLLHYIHNYYECRKMETWEFFNNFPTFDSYLDYLIKYFAFRKEKKDD